MIWKVQFDVNDEGVSVNLVMKEEAKEQEKAVEHHDVNDEGVSDNLVMKEEAKEQEKAVEHHDVNDEDVSDNLVMKEEAKEQKKAVKHHRKIEKGKPCLLSNTKKFLGRVLLQLGEGVKAAAGMAAAQPSPAVMDQLLSQCVEALTHHVTKENEEYKKGEKKVKASIGEEQMVLYMCSQRFTQGSVGGTNLEGSGGVDGTMDGTASKV